MALLKYFQKVTVPPNPDGPLSDHVPSAAIASANKEVGYLVVWESDVPDTTGSRKKRCQYLSYTDKEKGQIAKRACEYSYHVIYLLVHTSYRHEASAYALQLEYLLIRSARQSPMNRFPKFNFVKYGDTKFA